MSHHKSEMSQVCKVQLKALQGGNIISVSGCHIVVKQCEKKNVRTKRGVIKGHAHWQHRSRWNLHNKHILLEAQQPPNFMKSNPTQVNDVIWKCCRFKYGLLGPESGGWHLIGGQKKFQLQERPKCPKIKHDKQGLEGPLCLHSPGCLWEISLNLASDLSGSCNPRKRGAWE